MSSGDASVESAAVPGGSEALWQEDMNKMALGTRLLFLNDFDGAETMFLSGMKNDRSGTVAADGEVRDVRGAFALEYALVSVIRGVASLADDQLDECLERLWYAEELASNDSEWIGKSMVRGIVTLVGGVIQCLQHSFVKGVYNILKSWMWIKTLQTKAINYEGKEREVIRSCALLTLGIFNLLLSLLPASMLKAATFLSGFHGDRDLGLKMLLDCWREEGMFAPWGALIWVAYNVDTKTFLDEKLSDADMTTCEDIFRWASRTYPNSLFFSGIEADFQACRRNIYSAMEIVDRAAPYATDLKALEWALNYKRGVYELVDLNFANAARYFESSLEVYERVGRRSMVPFMGVYSFLCYNVVAEVRSKYELEHDEELAEQIGSNDESEDPFNDPFHDEEDDDELDAATAAAHADEMLALVAKYKALEKDNWGRQDRYAFALFDEYQSKCQPSDENSFETPQETWPLLDLVECMIIRMRCTRWMAEAQVTSLLTLLQQDGDARLPNVDEEVRVCAYFAQLLLERGEREPALEWCEKGLALEKELSTGVAYLPMLFYLKALNLYQCGQILASKFNVTRAEQTGIKDCWINHYIMFKANILKKQLAAENEESNDYRTETIAAGKAHQVVVPVVKGGTVSWDWTVLAHDIQFTCIFRPVNEDEIQEVDSVHRQLASDGPNVGYYVPAKDGDLIFSWDNRYSFMRNKKVIHRIVQGASPQQQLDTDSEGDFDAAYGSNLDSDSDFERQSERQSARQDSDQERDQDPSQAYEHDLSRAMDKFSVK